MPCLTLLIYLSEPISDDFTLDKGTFDALACRSDRSIVNNLCREMVRVSRTAAIIVSSGTPERRMHLYNECVEDKVKRIDTFALKYPN